MPHHLNLPARRRGLVANILCDHSAVVHDIAQAAVQTNRPIRIRYHRLGPNRSAVPNRQCVNVPRGIQLRLCRVDRTLIHQLFPIRQIPIRSSCSFSLKLSDPNCKTISPHLMHHDIGGLPRTNYSSRTVGGVDRSPIFHFLGNKKHISLFRCDVSLIHNRFARGSIKPHPSRPLAVHKLFRTDIERGRHKGRRIHRASRANQDSAWIDEVQNPVCAKGTVDGTGISPDHSVQGGGGGTRHIEMRVFTCRDVEALPVDGKAVGSLIDR